MGNRIRIAGRALWRREGEGIVILDEVSGEPYLLDAVGADVFEALQGGASVDEVVSGLEERYEGDPAAMRADVEELVAALRERALVEEVDE